MLLLVVILKDIGDLASVWVLHSTKGVCLTDHARVPFARLA